MAGIRYRPEIDGLRAVAVIPVVLFHLGFSWIRGGFIGVDVFFVISGFLITSIIRNDLENGSFSFREFWVRRIRRIAPAFIFVTGCTLALSHLFVFKPEQQAIGRGALAALGSVANVYFWRTNDNYWGSDSPFLHAWSLSVEEQFYLIFPIAMWFVVWLRPKKLPGCIAIVVVGSLALFLWGLQEKPTATFYLLPTRAWELGTGCLLAVTGCGQPPKDSRAGVFATLGLGLIFLSYWFFAALGVGVGLAVLGAALIIIFGQTGLSNTVLSHPLNAHIGKLSYSIYLWHWPLLVLAKPIGLDWEGDGDNVVLVIATYFLALLTHYLVEKPTRHRRGIIPAIFISGMAVAFAALQMARVPHSYDTSAYIVPKWIEYNCRPDWKPEVQNIFVDVDVTNPYYRLDAFDSGQGIQIGCESGTPQVVVFGDSHGTMWSDAIVGVAKQMNLPIALFVMNRGESPFFEIPVKRRASTANLTPSQREAYDEMRLKALKQWSPKIVIIGARWSYNYINESQDLLGYLESRRIPVLLLEDPPELPIPNVHCLQYLAFKRLLKSDTVRLDVQPSVDERNRALVREIAASHKNIKVVSAYDLFSSDGQVTVVDSSVPLYLDDDHLTTQGASRIGDRLREAMTEALMAKD